MGCEMLKQDVGYSSIREIRVVAFLNNLLNILCLSTSCGDKSTEIDKASTKMILPYNINYLNL